MGRSRYLSCRFVVSDLLNDQVTTAWDPTALSPYFTQLPKEMNGFCDRSTGIGRGMCPHMGWVIDLWDRLISDNFCNILVPFCER